MDQLLLLPLTEANDRFTVPDLGSIETQLQLALFAPGSRYDEAIGRSFLDAARRFRSGLLQLLHDLAAGTLDLPGFTNAANSALVRAYTEIFALGALSVDQFHNMTDRDLSVVKNEIYQEQRFLKAFGKDISDGFYVMDPDIRAGLYVQSLRGIFELGRAESLAPRPIDWILGDTHHCIPCLQAANGGPYRKDVFTANQNLPVLPGIPGSGDVCNGLTRCGCTLKTENAYDPGQQLQVDIRQILEAVVYGS